MYREMSAVGVSGFACRINSKVPIDVHSNLYMYALGQLSACWMQVNVQDGRHCKRL